MPNINLSLHEENAVAWRVLSEQAHHVGNLKRVGEVWKFKAIGYDANGAMMPGHGPLTHRHNMSFAALDAALICKALGGD